MFIDAHKKHQNTIVFFDCSNYMEAQVPNLPVPKTIFEHGRGWRDLPDPPEMEHKLWLTTHQQRAEEKEKMTEVLNKLLKLS